MDSRREAAPAGLKRRRPVAAITNLLRTGLVGATTLTLLALPASGQSRKPEGAALQRAEKELGVIEANIRAVEARMEAVRQYIASLKPDDTESGEFEYKYVLLQHYALLDRLQYRLDGLERRAAELRAKIKKTGAPELFVDDFFPPAGNPATG
jgi:hypothetical protein